MADWFLDRLMNMVERASIEGHTTLSVPLTLSVGGLLVSGQLIPVRHYLKAFAENFTGALPVEFDDDIRETMAEAFMAEEPPQPPPSQEGEVSDRPQASQFLHMKDVQFFHPSGGPVPLGPSKFLLWRGRLDSVDSFMLGNLD